MKISLRRVLNIVVLCCAVAAIGGPNVGLGSGTAQASDLGKAVAFTLKDLDGRIVKLSDYQGKPVLLYFMATWCPLCRDMIPRMKEIHSLYSAKGLVMLGISVMESREKVAAYSKRHALPYPTLLDGEGTVAKSYSVVGLPVLALIDRESLITCWNCRSVDKQLEKLFETKSN